MDEVRTMSEEIMTESEKFKNVLIGRGLSARIGCGIEPSWLNPPQ
jgi:hypothetical protein